MKSKEANKEKKIWNRVHFHHPNQHQFFSEQRFNRVYFGRNSVTEMDKKMLRALKRLPVKKDRFAAGTGRYLTHSCYLKQFWGRGISAHNSLHYY